MASSSSNAPDSLEARRRARRLAHRPLAEAPASVLRVRRSRAPTGPNHPDGTIPHRLKENQTHAGPDTPTGGRQMARIIELTVSPAGQATVRTRGYTGAECLKASLFLERALGIP